ncbi:NADH:flavin oxidoreductase [Roseovarius sp. MMSF_3281]|uniref:NADH:flavin oxidoreductase n=1 Tax=Roseovarius sp. MMSF_3281 TaxID=3046694 RepID=UPI00273E59DC|nr:NADH:flavin oxidoreductase [Roseovarius sp. MMSF_3281]
MSAHFETGEKKHSSTLSKDPLLQPFQIKGVNFKNRIISTSHASMLDDSGVPGERYIRYHEEKARGGLAMTMIGGSAMSSVDSSWGGGQIDLAGDSVIPHLQHLSQRIHAHGAKVMSQVSHLGRRATSFAAGHLPALAPSRVRETRTRNFPREMDEADIARVISDYAEAALRCKEGGLDGIETVTGGHLLGQFMSPVTNLRNDRFGGSLQNRARFVLMVHEAIRKAVGDEMLVGIRFVIDEASPEGLSTSDCFELARILEAEGHLDFFNAIFGRMDSDLVLSEHNMPGMFQRSAPFLTEVAAFRRETQLPLMHAAAVRDVATARHVISSGIVDLVGMTRAHIADPQIVQKLMQGQEERIRPCVGASYCLYKKVNCVHNPSTGRETVLPHGVLPASVPKTAVVVGGGAAGLEAARVLAERGHRVVLFEAGARLGGQILVAAAAEERRDLIGIVDWRVAELDRLGVDQRLNAFVDEADVLAERPDIVIMATGGLPDLDWLEGAEYCDTTWDILTNAVPRQQDVLIYDATGRQAAASCALKFGEAGASVRFVTPDDAVALDMPYTDKSGYRQRFARLNIPRLVEQKLVRVEKSGNVLRATLRHELSNVESQHVAEQIVIEHGSVPFDEAYAALRANSRNDGKTDLEWLLDRRETPTKIRSEGYELHQIGDAVSSRDIYSAIQDAFRLCRKL